MQNSTSTSSDAWKPADLYGGAIVCELPESFSDVSELRQIPDHQMVFCDSVSDRSVIVEILERKSEISDEQAVTWFLQDLATANEAQNATVVSSRALDLEEVPLLPADVRCFVGEAEQSVSKFNESVTNRLRIRLCAVRLVAQETDILITLNDPVNIDPQSSSADAPLAQGSEDFFARLLKSFKVVNWDLFSDS